MNAEQLLNAAASLLKSRGTEYDKDKQPERSMAQIVTAFNAVTGQALTELEGWTFMQILKMVRLHNSPSFHEDSAIDGIAYAALAAECGIADSRFEAELDTFTLLSTSE